MPAKPTTTVTPEQRQAAARSLRLDDEALLAECEQEVFIASGPGGQHRNKSETAVRLRHLPTGLVASATERRSQQQNKATALERLRAKLEKRAKAPKPRKKTKPTAASRRRRVEDKRRLSAKKRDRRELGER
ncbi:MAG: peptide chain release factor-like protein [Myxococcales bacterium]|jgi:ribosome-associated protein